MIRLLCLSLLCLALAAPAAEAITLWAPAPVDLDALEFEPLQVVPMPRQLSGPLPWVPMLPLELPDSENVQLVDLTAGYDFESSTVIQNVPTSTFGSFGVFQIVVPEPGTGLLLLAGLAGLLRAGRRR